MNFCSDNISGIHPRVLEALIAGNEGDVMPYGADPYTRRAETAFCEVFGCDVAVAMVATRTASNALAMGLTLRRFRRSSAARARTFRKAKQARR
jgi:threonine aldolase